MKKILCLLMACLSLPCQWASSAERVALLIGCGAYRSDTAPALDTPVPDMRLLQASLESPALAFQCLTISDASLEQFHAVLAKFKGQAAGAQVAMIFFSGHGIEHDGENFLIPVDAELETSAQLHTQTLPLTALLNALTKTEATVKLAVLDCCRNNPFAEMRSWASGKDVRDNVLRELGPAEIPRATVVCFATGAGRRAAAVLDDASKNSPFTALFAKEILVPGLSLRTVFENVQDGLDSATQGRQVPAVKMDDALSKVFRNTVLIPGNAPAVRAVNSVPSVPLVATMPVTASQPSLNLSDLTVLPADGGSTLPLVSGAIGKRVQVNLPGNVPMVFCYCPPGKFVMGSPESEANRSTTEAQANVKLSQGFWVAQTECTQKQWDSLMTWNSAEEKGDDLPIENVAPRSAWDFVVNLRKRVFLPDGWDFYLPTEAQWEYACRAGTTTAWCCGDDATALTDYACFSTIWPPSKTAKAKKVASFRANPWGIYDMHGNVTEYVSDETMDLEPAPGGVDPLADTGPLTVIRGGDASSLAIHCRSASRSKDTMSGNHLAGLRIVLSPVRVRR